MLFWQTGRGRRAQRRMIRWTRYIDRYDRNAQQPTTLGSLIGAPIRVTPGYFRAEGWDTRNPRSDLRHGC